jgi:hypothetical protein
MFIAALFTRGKLWKQPRCPTTDELMNGLRKCDTYIHTHKMEFYAIRKNEAM